MNFQWQKNSTIVILIHPVAKSITIELVKFKWTVLVRKSSSSKCKLIMGACSFCSNVEGESIINIRRRLFPLLKRSHSNLKTLK